LVNVEVKQVMKVSIRWIAVAMVATGPWIANAQQGMPPITLLPAGLQEVFGGISGDFSGASGSSEWDFDVGYGYYMWDNVEIGGIFGYQDSSPVAGLDSTALRLAVFGEYNWIIGDSRWVPSLSIALGFLDVELQSISEAANPQESAFETTIRPTVKYFLTDAVALDLGFDLRWASEKLYPDDAELKSTDYGISMRVRAHF
jgi:hypothetical protein